MTSYSVVLGLDVWEVVQINAKKPLLATFKLWFYGNVCFTPVVHSIVL